MMMMMNIKTSTMMDVRHVLSNNYSMNEDKFYRCLNCSFFQYKQINVGRNPTGTCTCWNKASKGQERGYRWVRPSAPACDYFLPKYY